jgi:hypothetical protein
MSSIYRKGRDGFFYYQTYLYNPKSGKKNKKIFHALGTRDRLIAEQKKESYDLKYSRIKSSSKNIFLGNKKNTIVFIAFLFFLLFYKLILKKNDKKSIENLIAIKQNEKKTKLDFSEKNFDNKLNKDFENNLETLIVEKEITAADGILAVYDIIGESLVSDIFNQGKVLISFEKIPNNEESLKICHSLKQKYSKYSNIIICGYTKPINNNEKHIESNLIFLYTYNEVEGEFFDMVKKVKNED